MGYENILVTLDGSVLAEEALKHAAAIAAPSAVIHVLSVIDTINAFNPLVYAEPFSGIVVDKDAYDMTPESNSEVLHDRQAYLIKRTETLVKAGHTVTCDTQMGDIVGTIIDTARDGYDVIVMATHGRTGIAKALLGSVAENVLHKAPCPVLLVPVHPAPKPE